VLDRGGGRSILEVVAILVGDGLGNYHRGDVANGLVGSFVIDIVLLFGAESRVLLV